MSELLKTNSNGQWELLDKSNYGPKGYKAYTVADNVNRKMNNTGDVVEGGGKNVNAKAYGGFGGKKIADLEAKKIAAKNKKQPVKIYTPEEIAQYNKNKMNKSEQIAYLPNGQWSLT